MIPFSLLWGGFAIFWEVTAISGLEKGHDASFPIFGLPFVVIGLYFIVGRFLYKAWRKRRTHYAVTDRRVITLERTPRGQRIQAAFVDLIPTVNKRVRRDGSGTIIFGNRSVFAQLYENTGMEFMSFGLWGDTSAVSFYDLPNVAEVDDLVRRLRSEGPPTRP